MFHAQHWVSRLVRLGFGVVAQMPTKLKLHAEISDELRLPATGRTEAASGHEDEERVPVQTVASAEVEGIIALAVGSAIAVHLGQYFQALG